MKYKDIAALAEAFKKGELKNYKLMIDNDSSRLVYAGHINADWEAPDGTHIDGINDEAKEWFEGKGYADISEALTAAGIPNEWC